MAYVRQVRSENEIKRFLVSVISDASNHKMDPSDLVQQLASKGISETEIRNAIVHLMDSRELALSLDRKLELTKIPAG